MEGVQDEQLPIVCFLAGTGDAYLVRGFILKKRSIRSLVDIYLNCSWHEVSREVFLTLRDSAIKMIVYFTNYLDGKKIV